MVRWLLDRFLSCDWSFTKMSINMRNAPTNCTDLVRERKNRFRTCYPQRTSKPAAILASSLPLTWRSVYRLCRRKEGSPTESSNSAIWPPIETLFLHSCLTPGSRKSSRFKSSLTGPTAPNLSAWPETHTPSCCCRKLKNPLVHAEDPSEEELSSLNKKLPPPYCTQKILKQMENVNTSAKDRDKWNNPSVAPILKKK